MFKRAIWIGFLGLLVLGVLLTACGQTSKLSGADLSKKPAPDFRLVDQDGQSLALSDLRGKVVVLTFMYTQCTDDCPLIAGKLHTISEQLGAALDNVAYVAVSIDPANDTPAAINQFTSDHPLDGQLRFLNGSEAALKPVWTAYAVQEQGAAAPVHQSVTGHPTRVILIDKAGRERSNFDSDFDPADLMHDLHLLLNEPSS